MTAPPPAARRARPYLLLSLAALFWAGNFVLGRAVQGRIPPVGLAFWRWVAALVLLLPVVLGRGRAQWPLLRRSAAILVPLGILGVGNFNTLVYVGLQETTATNAVLLNSACPAFIAAIVFASGGGRATGRQLVGIAASLLGVAVIISGGDPSALAALSFHRGDLWVLAAVLSWAGYTVLLPRRPAGVDPLVLLAALVAVGVAWIAPFYAWEVASGARVTWNAVTVGSVAYVAIFASVAAYAFWNRAVAEVGASRAGVFLNLIPAFGSLLAILLLGESFRLFHLAGVALVLGGVYLAGTASAGTGRPDAGPRAPAGAGSSSAGKRPG